MKQSDLKYLRIIYDEFRSMLFNNDIPKSSEIKFTLHKLTFAAGYSKYVTKPRSDKKIHVLAFAQYLRFDLDELQEILIHEMIHIWQVWHVKEDRYKKCSNDIAHDRVFKSKMNTINLILERYGYNLRISETYKHKLQIDKRIKLKSKVNVVTCIRNNRKCVYKVKKKDLDTFTHLIKNDKNVKNVNVFKTDDVKFAFIEYTNKSNPVSTYERNLIDIEEIYNSFNYE